MNLRKNNGHLLVDGTPVSFGEIFEEAVIEDAAADVVAEVERGTNDGAILAETVLMGNRDARAFQGLLDQVLPLYCVLLLSGNY